MRTTTSRLIVSFLLVFAACSPSSSSKLPPPVSPTNHAWFPLGAGTGHEYGKAVAVDGTIECKSCHDETKSFIEFQCISCHKHPTAIVARLHDSVKPDFIAAGGATSSAGCYQCHATGEKQPFSHTGIPADSSGACAECHQVDSAFAALPRPGFTHSPEVPGECGGCHKNVVDWADVTAGGVEFDPTRSLVVNAGQPTWSGTRITAITREQQIIPMKMNHQATAMDAGVLAVCSNCHAQADQGAYYPGVMHWSLVNLGAPQPTTCLDCHDTAAPTGFVGADDPRRSPVSGEMRHDVRWASTGPQTLGCQVCHQPPDSLVDTQWSFANGRSDGGIALVHASLTAAGIAQPTACLDCHANTRPVLPVVAAMLTFDHSTALGECISCHTSTSSWAGGQFHTASAPAPTTCLPCHAGDRPTSTTGWVGPYLTSPFDFVTNANGLTHGSDQDCAVCHAGPVPQP